MNKKSLAGAIQAEQEEAANTPPAPPAPPVVNPSKIGIALVPFTPVDFQADPLLAWGRLALYGTAAYLLWGKSKPLSYAALAAGGVSLATSLSAKAMK